MRRREFITQTAGLGMAAVSSSAAQSVSPDKPVRVGMVGVGSRGTSLTRVLLDMPAVEVKAMADIDDNNLTRAQKLCVDKGRPRPDGYPRGAEDFRRMVERDDLDAVITATPWQWHTPVMLAAMDAGKYCATEVPAAVTVDECWALVEKSEKTGVYCTMLENWVYRREPLAVLNMVRAGLLGQIVHCESGYGHDVRFTKFDARKADKGELQWRGEHSVTRDGNLYPTHQFAPIAMLMDVNRGTRIEYLVSMSTVSRGMNQYAADRWGADHPAAKREYANGDVTTTLIKLENGTTITQYHDTQSWHPRDDGHKYHGTKGMVRWPFPAKGSIYTTERHWDGKKTDADEWHPLDPFLDEFDHDIWKTFGDRALRFGHSGADWMEIRGFVESVRRGVEAPVTVYDAATWSVIGPLSEQSIANEGRKVEVPDFTKGKWKSNPPFELKWQWG